MEKQLKLLINSLGRQILENEADPASTTYTLYTETLKFRKKLQDETGHNLTVEDTQAALNALELHLSGNPLPKELTPEQKSLARIWIDRLTVFRKSAF